MSTLFLALSICTISYSKELYEVVEYQFIDEETKVQIVTLPKDTQMVQDQVTILLTM